MARMASLNGQTDSERSANGWIDGPYPAQMVPLAVPEAVQELVASSLEVQSRPMGGPTPP